MISTLRRILLVLVAPVPFIMARDTEDVVTLRLLVLAGCLLALGCALEVLAGRRNGE